MAKGLEMEDKGVPTEWYTRLATMALEAIEAGPNATFLMNLEGIKEHLRAAKEGKHPMLAGVPASPLLDAAFPELTKARNMCSVCSGAGCFTCGEEHRNGG